MPKLDRSAQVISPPVERYIESVCDLKPILAEIGESLRQQSGQQQWQKSEQRSEQRSEQQSQQQSKTPNEKPSQQFGQNNAEIGLSPSGNFYRRRYEKETKVEDRLRKREEETTFTFRMEAPKMRGSQSVPDMPSSSQQRQMLFKFHI
jgi:hypothetical protein